MRAKALKALESLATMTSSSTGERACLSRRLQPREDSGSTSQHLGQIDAELVHRKARSICSDGLTQKEIENRVAGRSRDTAPPPPPIDTLQKIALDSRPDIAAYRLGVTLTKRMCGWPGTQWVQ